MPFDKVAYDMAYNRAHISRIYVMFNKDDATDTELLAWIRGKGRGNVNSYIKSLVLADMQKTGNAADSMSIRLSDVIAKPQER